MAKPQNLVSTQQVTISTTPQVLAYLSQLVATGLYGKNLAEAAERIVVKSVESLLKEGILKSVRHK